MAPAILLDSPKLDEALEAIQRGLSKRKTVVIAGLCRVDYQGRASSKLEPGERLVILKGDGSALVHRPRDYSPVNWQPPGSLFRSSLRDGELRVRVYRRKENESMEVAFSAVIMAAVLDLHDSAEFNLHATERDMQKAILLEPSLLEEGFRPITHEHSVYPGFIDILGRDKDGVLVVAELKRVKAGKEAVLQLKKYMEVIDLDEGRKVRAVLVAPSLGRGVQELLVSLGFEYKELSPQSCAEVLKRRAEGSLAQFFQRKDFVSE